MDIMEKKLLKLVFILAGIALLAVITFFLTKTSTPNLSDQNQQALSDQELSSKQKLMPAQEDNSLLFQEESNSLGEDLYEKSSSNISESLTKLNPFEGIKTNPFK